MVDHSFLLRFLRQSSGGYFWSFGLNPGGIWASIWVTFDTLFAPWRYLGLFWKSVLSCARELKKQGLRVPETAPKSNTSCSCMWYCFGNRLLRANMPQRFKKVSQKGSRNEAQVFLGRSLTVLFSPGGPLVRRVDTKI